MGLRLKNLYVSIDYENELYENHSFINGSNNLWTEIFEPGSFQRTNSLMFNIEKTIFN